MGTLMLPPAGLHFLFGERWNIKEWKSYFKS